jgi:hypothetical protein
MKNTERVKMGASYGRAKHKQKTPSMVGVPGMTTKEAKESILEVQVDAALAGHDLGPFEPVDPEIGGYQAACRRCGKTVWVGNQGLIYSLLGDACEGEGRTT